MHKKYHIKKSVKRKEGYNIQIPGVIFKKSSQILIKEAFFLYKMYHNFKKYKSYEIKYSVDM